jgi:hypothetical protein
MPDITEFAAVIYRLQGLAIYGTPEEYKKIHGEFLRLKAAHGLTCSNDEVIEQILRAWEN